MRRLGAIVLSHEEVGELASLVPWKLSSIDDLARTLFRETDLSGLVYLSTCNRVSFFYSLKSTRHTDFALALLASLPPLPAGKRPAFYQGKEVLRHLLSLAAGLESMVLGETEIRAQLKNAFRSAEEAGHLDRRLRQVLPAVFAEARNIRNSIPFTNLPLSVASLALKKFTEAHTAQHGERALSGQKIAIIGSGPMSAQAVEYARKRGLSILLVNRSLEKIAPLCERTGADRMLLQDFLENPESQGPLAAIFSATSAPHYILDQEVLGRLKSRPILIDLAVPRDIDPSAARNFTLICMETLKKEVEANQQKRRAAAAFAREFIEDSLFRIKADFIAAIAAPVIRNFQRDVRNISRERLSELFDSRLNHLSMRDRNLIYDWAIRANRDLNRLHRSGLARVLHTYYRENDAQEGLPPLPDGALN
ncbi:MAG: hypothetical protein HS115_13350 [Spirochaetales bacterium]|nr:hypothetical protein [Spirochaetales bacterium]